MENLAREHHSRSERAPKASSPRAIDVGSGSVERKRHVCPACHSLVIERDRFCGDCGTRRPRDSWEPIDRAHEPWLGTFILDDWFATRRLGSGSSGVVYRVRSEALDQTFAAKVINLDTPAHRSRRTNLATARREADVVSKLENPHIVGIYDIHRLDERFAVILMDYVDASTLRQTVERDGPCDTLRALKITRQIAHGLHEAHEQGMIHRDIKPENILIERRPSGDDFVRITDFGLASPARSAVKPGGFVGTPLWASPEQILEKPLEATSDIYSLGATLFYLLTGRPPFRSPDSVTVLRAHVTELAPSLSDASTGFFSRAVERLVASLLAKSPDERPQDLLEVVAWIDEILRNESWESSLPSASTPVPTLAEESETVDARPEDSSGAPGPDVDSSWRGIARSAGRSPSSVAESRVDESVNVAASDEAGIYAVADRHGVEVFHYCDDEVPVSTIDVDDVTSVAISRDGHLLATLTGEGSIMVWAVATGQPLHEFEPPARKILGLRFGASSLSCVCETDETIVVVDLQQGGAARSLHP